MDARLFIFDGDCAFCSSAARVFRKMIKDQVPIRPYQKLDLASLGLSEELLRVPGINHLAERIYYWIAKNRHRLPGGTPECSM
jgi:predicted DCC family thiol-disulfide oxidoreductase YuxK